MFIVSVPVGEGKKVRYKKAIDKENEIGTQKWKKNASCNSFYLDKMTPIQKMISSALRQKHRVVS